MVRQFVLEADVALCGPWAGVEWQWWPTWWPSVLTACAGQQQRGRAAGAPTVLENLMGNWENCFPNHIVKGRRRREEYILGHVWKPVSAKAVGGFHIRCSNVPVGLVSCIFHRCAFSHKSVLSHNKTHHHHELCTLPDYNEHTAQSVQNLPLQTKRQPGLGTPSARLYRWPENNVPCLFRCILHFVSCSWAT